MRLQHIAQIMAWNGKSLHRNQVSSGLLQDKMGGSTANLYGLGGLSFGRNRPALGGIGSTQVLICCGKVESSGVDESLHGNHRLASHVGDQPMRASYCPQASPMVCEIAPRSFTP